MAMKREYEGRNCVGDIKSITGSSMALNGQRNVGGEKPSPKGNDSPGGTKPMRDNESPMPIPMPK